LGTASFGNDMPIAQSGIYPNPAKDKITVQLNELNGTANITVTDINGKMVMQQRSADVTTELNISKLPSGIYMVKAIENGKINNWKFVKE
jgi:hypothetical protein